MNALDFHDDRGGGRDRGPARRGPGGRGAGPAMPGPWPIGSLGLFGLVCLVLGSIAVAYHECKIEVGTGEQAILIRKEGLDLERDMELAPPRKDGKTYYK